MRRKAALMSRVSSDEQAKGYSLDVQSEALEKYCLKNDIEIVYSFREDHSAKSFNRPAFQKFLEHTKKNHKNIDLLLFSTWDRFSRNAMDAYHMIDRMRKMGIEAQSIEQPIDFSIPENKMMLAMYLVMPEIDNDRRSIKIRGGIRGAKKAGRWTSSAPYGYRNSRDDQNKPLLVPNQDSEHIRRAFEDVSKGGVQSEIVKALNANGVKVQKTRFSIMLRNPVYMGKIRVLAFENEPEELVEGVHEAIVPEELFYKVQQVLKGNFPRKHLTAAKRNDMLPLRGILKCTKCGNKLTGSRSRGRRGIRYAYYHCNGCRQERYRADRVNNQLKKILNGFQFSNDSEVLFKAIISKLLDGNGRDRTTQLIKLRKSVALQNERIERLQDNLADGVITSVDFVEMKGRYSELRQQAIEKINALDVDNSDKRLMIRKALDILSNLGEHYESADSKAKLKLLGSIFPEMIEFDGTKCRTPRVNEALALCVNIDRGLSKKQNRTLHDKLQVSGMVEPEGFEPSSKQ